MKGTGNDARFGCTGLVLWLTASGLVHCSSTSGSSGVSCAGINPDAAATTPLSACYPDTDGLTGGAYTIDLAVDDSGFTSTGGDDTDGGVTRNVIGTQNDARVTLTLTNKGTVAHGFQVGCVSVCGSYPRLPAGCSPLSCFPAGSAIPPMAPGASTTITFDTPTPDGLLYPFSSSAPGDSVVPGLNGSMSQWSLM
jgi:hypothetical protein